MVERESPLLPVYRPGTHGHAAGGAGVRLIETRPGSIVQLAAWHGQENAALGAIRDVSGLVLTDRPGAGRAADTRAAFGIAPRRWLVVDQAEGLGAKLSAMVGDDVGTVTDLSHGRTAIRVSGPLARWVLSKLFAVDFHPAAFPVGNGLSTAHHDIFAQIQRTGPDQFDIYVFRSFARAFWTTLCHAAEETGYEVV